MTLSTGRTDPPEDWLALSEAERALAVRKANDSNIVPPAPVLPEPFVKDAPPTPVQNQLPSNVRAEPARQPNLAEITALADSLDADERVHLIGHLWESLPARYRGELIATGFNSLSRHRPEPLAQVDLPPIDPIWPKLHSLLFDPSKTSDLYSAPRRFDLATIFVVTAAYSLLFGAMTVLNFSAVVKVTIAIVVTAVGACQAFYHSSANPRGVSVIAGMATQSLIVLMFRAFAPQWMPGPVIINLIFVGVILGAFSGYLSGVLVGGVFLIADRVRKYFANNTVESPEAESPFDDGSDQKGDSPWAN